MEANKDKYELISLDDYVQSGEGGTSLTYNKKDGTSLAKLFLPGLQADTAAREFHVCETVYSLGISSPKPLRLITDGERYGAEYELITPKRSFTRIISEEPDKLEELSIRFARVSKELHSTQADTTALPSMKGLMGGWVDKCRNLLTDEEYDALHRSIDKVQDATTCLHGDLHIGNIIRTTGRDLWIDLGDFAYGDPRWDLCMLYYSANFLTEQRCDSIFHNTRETMARHWQFFAREYYGISTEEELRRIEKEFRPFTGVKMFYVITKITGRKSPFASDVIRRYLIEE